MRWQSGRRSVNVEDRRGRGGMFVGGGIGTLVLIVVALLFGINPGDLMQENSAPPAQETSNAPADEGSEFVRHVLGDTEDTWNTIFQQGGRDYPEPKLVLFSGGTQTGCGVAQTAIGPFYCPTDQTVYIDLSFYDDLRSRFGASGDFAQAYVIAHEVGHHVQNVLGVLNSSSSGGAGSNEQSVRLELQADCLAGIWAHHAESARNLVESGDIQEALNAAAAIGDDRLQQRSQGYVVPESFTHGSSEQRVNAFRAGYQSGTLQGCN